MDFIAIRKGPKEGAICSMCYGSDCKPILSSKFQGVSNNIVSLIVPMQRFEAKELLIVGNQYQWFLTPEQLVLCNLFNQLKTSKN